MKYSLVLQQIRIINLIGAENLWFCMKCGEFLKDHPANIQSICFDHMCDDLVSTNVAYRMNKVIVMLKSAESSLQKEPTVAKPESLRGWLKKSISTKISSIQRTGLMFLILITMLFVINFNQMDQVYDSSPYDSNQWQLLQTFGDMVDH